MKDKITMAFLKTTEYKICFWLTIIYLVNAVLSIAFGNRMLMFFLNDMFLSLGLVCTMVIVIGCYLGSFLTGKTKFLKLLLAASSLTLVPLVAEVYLLSYDSADAGFITDAVMKGYDLKVSILFIELMICELILIVIWKLSSPSRRKRNMILAFIIYMFLCGMVIKFQYDQWLFWGVVTELLLFFLSINLCGMLLKKEEKGEAEIVRQLVCVVNPVGMLFSMKGKTIGTLVYR